MKKLRLKISETRALVRDVDVESTGACEMSYLLAVPGMLDSLKEGLAQSPVELAKSLDW